MPKFMVALFYPGMEDLFVSLSHSLTSLTHPLSHLSIVLLLLCFIWVVQKAKQKQFHQHEWTEMKDFTSQSYPG